MDSASQYQHNFRLNNSPANCCPATNHTSFHVYRSDELSVMSLSPSSSYRSEEADQIVPDIPTFTSRDHHNHHHHSYSQNNNSNQSVSPTSSGVSRSIWSPTYSEVGDIIIIINIISIYNVLYTTNTTQAG